MFEELDQDDNIMKQIFDEIQNIPNKDSLPKDLISKSFPNKKNTSTYKLISKVDQELDLHGKTREESILMVQKFLISCYEKKYLNGLIITGKGQNSGEKGPVLKKMVKSWLEKNGKDYIIDFHEAPPRLGGSGAIWLNFKKNVN